jgi:histidyl-tRNA synthetase
VDIVGEESVAADAEVLAVAIDALRELGLGAEDFRARVSDRRLLTALLEALGVAAELVPAAFSLIDKIERMSPEAARDKLRSEVGLDEDRAGRLLGLLAKADPGTLASGFADEPAVLDALRPVRDYLAALDAMGLGEFVEMDLTIVRGLAYYTGIVFELFDRQGELRAICGGGRYDRLLELVGGEPLPAVGFGMGDVVLGELLADRGLTPAYRRAVDYFLVPIGDEQRPAALALAHRLRERGRRVVYALRSQSVRRQLKSAEVEGARWVLVLGPDEAARGVVVLRDMSDGTEREVPESELS